MKDFTTVPAGCLLRVKQPGNFGNICSRNYLRGGGGKSDAGGGAFDRRQDPKWYF